MVECFNAVPGYEIIFRFVSSLFKVKYVLIFISKQKKTKLQKLFLYIYRFSKPNISYYKFPKSKAEETPFLFNVNRFRLFSVFENNYKNLPTLHMT